jgi:FHA domain
MTDEFVVLTLFDLVTATKSKNAASFGDWLGELVLVGPPQNKNQDEWSYRTNASRSIPIGDKGPRALFEEDYAVYPLRKRKPGPFADTVLIGRTSTNDVVIADTGISKLHARIKRKGDGTFMIEDAQSSNGTFLRGQRLLPDLPKPLRAGDTLAFGPRSFHVFDAAGIYRVACIFAQPTSS